MKKYKVEGKGKLLFIFFKEVGSDFVRGENKFIFIQKTYLTLPELKLDQHFRSNLDWGVQTNGAKTFP